MIDLELLQDSPHLLDILLQMEDVLDSMDVYVFKNWLKGEVVEGPIVRRYWLDMTLRYNFHDMPDPRAGLRLLKHDIRVDFEKARYESSKSAVDESDGDDEVDEDDLVWLVRVSIPRRLVVQVNSAQHDFYDDEVDVEQVEDAKDDGMDDEESGYTNDTMGDEPMDDGPMGDDPMGAPMPGGPK